MTPTNQSVSGSAQFFWRPLQPCGPTANHGGLAVSLPIALAGLRFFPQIWSDPSERGPQRKVRRSSPDDGGLLPTVASERIHRPRPSPAYVFSRKYGPIRPNGASTKKSAGARQTAVGRRWPDRQPWRPRGFTALDPRRPMFVPANMVRSVRKGASPEKFAGPGRTTADGRWPDISSAIWGGGREKSPHMAFVGL